MSRISFWINLVLLAAVIGLGWKLYEVELSREQASVSSPPVVQGPGFAVSDPIAAISARLSAIDARLSAIEQRQGTVNSAVQKKPFVEKPIGPQASARANERLAAIVRGDQFDQNAMIGFNLEMAKLPEEEQIALAAALTQSINQGRIKPIK